MAQLQGYDWPGNIRELRNLVERAVILARGSALEFDLPTAGATLPTAPPPTAVAQAGSDPEFFTEPEMQQRDRENLLTVLKKTGWKIKGPHGAAELLGLKPTTLLSRIKKMGLKRPG
jgi:transcriptional regulator with GAF, ATPase, and Fis domain